MAGAGATKELEEAKAVIADMEAEMKILRSRENRIKTNMEEGLAAKASYEKKIADGKDADDMEKAVYESMINDAEIMDKDVKCEIAECEEVAAEARATVERLEKS